MVRRLRSGLSLFASLLLVGPASADEEFESLWSATLMGQFKVISDEEAHDHVTGFFDQYEFTPNKSSSVPFELAVRDASYDLFGSGETPRLQFRLQSPTSNLGVSGSQIDSPFLNQRADLLGRFDGIHFDLDYRRMRTEELRLFPVSIPGFGPQFTDRTSPGDRFFHERTGFTGELRLRPADLIDREVGWLKRLAPEVALRGGYQGRNGQSQYRFMVEPQNAWLAHTREHDQSVGDVGGGVLVAPGGLFTLALDFDYKQFREDAPFTLQSDLGPPVTSNSRVIGFIPDTNQTTGTVRLNSRIGDRAVLEGGFQISQLEQVGDLTPEQLASGLVDNSVRYYSANFAADVSIVDRVSANAYFKFDQRDNDIQRNTSLFNPLNGTQVDEYLKQWRRILVGFETSYHPARRSRVALGVRFEAIDRELDFVPPGTGNRRILPANALTADETRMYTIYGRTNVRPAKGLSVFAELGYRGAPSTGYIVDLDKYVYGKLRASYALPIEHPVVLSAFAQGGSGENRDFTMVDGLGPLPGGPEVSRNFDRYDYTWGITATTSVKRDTTLFASFFMSRDAQDYDLVVSNVQRYFQDVVALGFGPSGGFDYVNDQLSLRVGSHSQITEKTDAGLSYSFTSAETLYNPSAAREVSLIGVAGLIDSDIHGLDFEVGHWLKDGLRILVGYRLQLNTDGAPLTAGNGSVVTPFDLSMSQHTVTLGVTLTNDLWAKGG
ncbi:MAG: MtrB/PioB family outer membrane beta-barrel protein [Deltaproteobacteria bacterium]|nr:MtrB/PioB family outer membrane beta-barrel protein [Deltaproteobacteria bacterium]